MKPYGKQFNKAQEVMNVIAAIAIIIGWVMCQGISMLFDKLRLRAKYWRR
jgi:hypothetical protein